VGVSAESFSLIDPILSALPLLTLGVDTATQRSWREECENGAF
jgi:hypothetical protein